ncbi:MAG: sodium ion-translocating decarboxylase subunit beta, partial [Pirellulaceae bacterium]|nr:sodium ion-translocating decarboxylase subunit beta [Pirellulaceae bacterium]
MEILLEFLKTTGFAGLTFGNLIMMLIGMLFIYLAITRHYEPLLLVPIGFGAIVGNIPTIAGMSLSVYDGPVAERDLAYYKIEIDKV